MSTPESRTDMLRRDATPKPHCERCGRYVSNVYGGGRCKEPELYYEFESCRATCAVHGDVYVSWDSE